jgi:hypothetical protein
MRGGRFEADGGLLEFSSGELLSRAYRARGIGAQVEVEVRALLSQVNDSEFVSYDAPQPPYPRRRPTHLRDCFVQSPTVDSVVPFIRELTPATFNQGATGVPEATPKAEVMIEFTGASNPTKKIAAWVPVTEEIVIDGPGLSAYINTRLVEMLYVREDAQIVAGNGVGASLSGILTDPLIQTSSAGASKREALTIGISDVEDVEAAVDTVVLNPADAWAIFNAQPLWFEELADMGVRTVRTVAMAPGTALVGAFLQAAHLRIRKEATLRIATQADDDFVSNKLKVLVELREAFNVTAPDLLCAVTLPGTA